MAHRLAPRARVLVAGPRPRSPTAASPATAGRSLQAILQRRGRLSHLQARGLEPGLRFPDPKQIKLDATEGRLQLPKLDWLRLRLSRTVKGEIRNVTLSREGQRWYASIQTQGAEVLASPDLRVTLGIDLGVTAFAATSEGMLIKPLSALKRQQCRLRRYQRSVSRKVKGSSNRKKAIRRLGDLHRKIARQRSNWLHQLSTQLVKDHPVIAIEDLKVKNMNASCSGRGRKAKAGLNKGILDAAWAEFRRQLDYKTAAVGGHLVAVNPAYTSQQCRVCGHTHKDNRSTQALFLCVACGHTENADLNASQKILARGQSKRLAAHILNSG